VAVTHERESSGNGQTAELVGGKDGNGQAAHAGPTRYQTRRISRERLSAVRKAGGLGPAILVDHFQGLLVVEPVGGDVGDGAVLPPDSADYELRPEWCLTPTARLAEARRLLGLEADLVTGRDEG
jgi:hypothetical protein